jgi:hypothetical protein
MVGLRGCRIRVRGRHKLPRGGRAFQRGELYVEFAWNLRVMIYTSDVSVRCRLNVARRLKKRGLLPASIALRVLAK